MEKFTNKRNKEILEAKSGEVTFESIIKDMINDTLTLNVEEEVYSIGGIDKLVEQFTTILKVSGAKLDENIENDVNLYHDVNKYCSKTKDIIRLYETYSDDGFLKIADSKNSKINDIRLLESTLAFLNAEVQCEKTILYKKSILNRIAELKK